jgi:hypothetical protein
VKLTVFVSPAFRGTLSKPRRTFTYATTEDTSSWMYSCTTCHKHTKTNNNNNKNNNKGKRKKQEEKMKIIIKKKIITTSSPSTGPVFFTFKVTVTLPVVVCSSGEIVRLLRREHNININI